MTGSSCVCKPITGAYFSFGGRRGLYKSRRIIMEKTRLLDKYQCVHMKFLSRALVTKPSKSLEILYYITSNAFSISAKKGLGAYCVLHRKKNPAKGKNKNINFCMKYLRSKNATSLLALNLPQFYLRKTKIIFLSKEIFFKTIYKNKTKIYVFHFYC